MSLYSRDYMRDSPSWRGAGPRSWSVVTWLIVVNTAVFLLVGVLLYRPGTAPLAISWEGLKSGHVWTFLTYQFSHYSLFHLLMNMLLLFFLGRALLQLKGPREVLTVYLLGGVVGALFQLAFDAVTGPGARMQGASASIMAIVFAVITLEPYRSVQLLFPPIKLTLRQMGWLLIGINALYLLVEFSSGPRGGGPRTAVFSHFGGMCLGWWWTRRQMTKKRPLRSSRPTERESAPKAPWLGIRFLKDGEEPEDTTSREGKKKTFVAKDVDAILDKINEHGFHSLTREEKELLEKSSERLAKRVDKQK